MYKLTMKSPAGATVKTIVASVEPGKTLSESQRNRVKADLARVLLIKVSANLENPLLSDSDFRRFLRNSIPATLGD